MRGAREELTHQVHDAIHPHEHQILVTELTQALPTSCPSGLSSFLRAILLCTSSDEKTHSALKTCLVGLSVFVRCHSLLEKNPALKLRLQLNNQVQQM